MTISLKADPDGVWSQNVAPFVTLVIMQHLDIQQTAIDFTLDAMGVCHSDLIPLHGLNYDGPIDPFTLDQQEYWFALRALAEQASEMPEAVDMQAQHGWLM